MRYHKQTNRIWI